MTVNPSNKEVFKNQLLGYNIEGFETNLQREFFRRFDPVSVRFPHGVWANFYKWQTDGYQQDDYDNGGHQTTLNQYVQSVKGHINSIASLNQERKDEQGSGFHMMWTYSMNFDDAESCVARAHKDIALGLEVKDIELGNEHFWINQRSNQTKTPQDFLARAKSVAEALRAEFPDVRVSIPLGWRRNQGNYNNIISGDKQYYDAITVHKYMGSDPDVPGESNNAYSALLTARTTLEDDINWVRSNFGAKPIWLTEWGVSAGGGTEVNSAACLGMADVFLFMSENQHIYDRANWFSFNRILNSMVHVTTENNRQPVYPLQRRGYLSAYEMVHDVLLDSTMLESSVSTVKINGGVGDMNVVNARIVEKDGKTTVIAVNLSDKPVNFSVVSGGAAYNGSFKHEALVFDGLGSVPNVGIDVNPVELIKDGPGTVTLPPLSVNKIGLTPISPLSPWENTDIGNVGIGGAAVYDEGSFHVSGSGGDIWGQNDRFHYVYQPIAGDVEITVRVPGMDDTHAAAKAGIMIRESLDSGSRHFSTFVTPGQGVSFNRRTTTGGFSAATAVPDITTPTWLRISRVGHMFRSSWSPDGITWHLIGSQGFSISSNIFFGLAVTSRNDSSLCNAIFENITIQTATPVANAGEDVTVTDHDANGIETVVLDGSASSANPGATITSHVWTQAGIEIATGENPSVDFPIGVHPLTLTITTSSGAIGESSVTVTVEPALPQVVTAINAGGPTYTALDGTAYLASTGFAGATASSTATNISNTPDVALYQTHLFGTFTWAQPVPNGSYTLILRFSENWANATSQGKRLFSVDVEGRRRITNLDLFVEAPGQYHAHDVALPVTIFDGELNLAFTPTVNNGLISAIVLLSVPYPDTNHNGIPDTWELEYFGNLHQPADGDWNSDGVSNLHHYIAGTSPIDPQSAFRIKNATHETDSGFTVRWESITGRTYTVMKSTTLSGDWLPASEPMPGTGSELFFTDPDASPPGCFYRIGVEIR